MTARKGNDNKELDHKNKTLISGTEFYEIDITLAKWKDNKAWINNAFGSPVRIKRKEIEVINSPISYSYMIIDPNR